MLFRKIVSSNNGHYYLSLYLAHAPWIRQGINSWLEKFRIFGKRKSHIAKVYVGAGGRRIKEILIDFAVKAVPIREYR